MNRFFLSGAAFLGAIAVLAGAFGAHALETRVTAETMKIYETGVRYQFYHVFALMAAGVLSRYFPGRALLIAGRCFFFGILLFSGSLYLMAFIRMFHHNIPAAAGLLTPLGGILLLAGWIALLAGILRGTSGT